MWISVTGDRFPHLCPRVIYLLSLCSSRAGAVVWGMDVFINWRIEYYVFARTFCLDRSLKFYIYSYLTAWHDVKQNKCNHDPQIANNNKIGVSSCVINFQAFLVSAVAFLSKTASSMLGTCTLFVPHLQTIMSLLLRPN